MGIKFVNKGGKDFYVFWGEWLFKIINVELVDMLCLVVVNFVFEEYFKVVVGCKINGQLIQLVFEDWKSGKYKIISFYVKWVCGLMMCYVVFNCLIELEGLKDFDFDGYVYVLEVFDEWYWVFCCCLD